MGIIKAMIKMTFVRITLIIGVFLLVGFFGSWKIFNEKKVAQSGFDRAVSRQCVGAEATGVEYAIAGSRINVRMGPGTSHEIIVDQKATSTLGKTRYVQIDNAAVVLEACRKGSWSFIQVINPDWLRDSHQGWVASRFLGRQLRDAAGVRIFAEDDFIWDKNTLPYKDTIVAAVNRIHRENSRCKEIDPNSAYLSGSKSSPGKPVFFVTCSSGAEAFNVWFSKDDLDSEKTFEDANDIDTATAISICEEYAHSAASHLSTVDFSRGTDLAIIDHPNGQITVISTFTGKTSLKFGLKFQIRCLLDATGLIEAKVYEAG